MTDCGGLFTLEKVFTLTVPSALVALCECMLFGQALQGATAVLTVDVVA